MNQKTMSMAFQPLVSVVTPVHNEVEFLPECIESVLVQTYQNWDYVIVDNCSTDGSAEIAEKYAHQDRRIRVHRNKKFLHAIPNHNAALRQISPGSKYCKVVFGDDWLFPECLERMVAAAEENPSVGIVSAYTLEGQRVTLSGLPYRTRVVSGREICRKHFLEQLYLFGSANSLLYRADLVRDRSPFFNESNIHADTEVCFALLRNCDFGFVHQVLTFTRVRPGSLSTHSSSIQSDFACMLHILKRYGPDFLTDEELRSRIEEQLSAYYQYLGKNMLLGRADGFWQWHKREMSEAGVPLSRARLAIAALAELCDALLHPRHSINRLLKRAPGIVL